MCDTVYEDYIANNSSDEALNDYAYLLSDREGINKAQLLNALKMEKPQLLMEMGKLPEILLM